MEGGFNMKAGFIYLAGLLIVGAFASAVVYVARGVNYNDGYAPVQPVPFSHAIHAGENKIACQYCHYASEQGKHAGIPPTELCLNCHNHIRKDSPNIQKIKEHVETQKPLEWVKVNHYPDFAYFNHAQHVRVGKVACQECHGPVQQMTRLKQEKNLSMGMCIDCHRKNEIAPPNDHKSKKGGDCASCHH
jgi:hypothetical protein